MKLSIVIVNWNTRELLGQCLRSIEMHTAPDLLAETEIFVVDNGSTDGSGAMLQRAFAHVHLLQNSQNVGFASANNQAIRQSRGQYVLLLNPDTWVRPGALDALVAWMDNCPDAGAAGSLLIGSDGRMQPSCHPAPTLRYEFWRLLHLDRFYPLSEYRMHQWPRSAAHEVDVVQGASLIVRRSVLEEVGLLDEEYFMYTEEVDLCYRIRKAGCRIYWVPTSHVIHFGGQSTKQKAAEMFLYLYQSKILYFRKRHGRQAARLYKVVLYLVGLLRVLISPLASILRPGQRQQHRLLSRHYRRLLLSLPNM